MLVLRKRWMVFFLLSLYAGFVQAEGMPLPEVEKLANGLEVVWFNRPNLPLVDLTLVVKAGFRDDLPGKSGTAALLTALLDRGAGGMSALEMGKAVESLGASRFLSAEDDQISLQLHGLASDAERLLDLLAKIALSPGLLESEFRSEQKRILDYWEHIDSIDNRGDVAATIVQHRVLTSGTSYPRGAVWSLGELKKVTRADVSAFHKKYFVPAHSVLLVVGPVDRALLKKQLSTLFDSTSTQSSTATKTATRVYRNYSDSRLSHKGRPVYVLGRPGSTQAQMRLAFRVPALSSETYYPLVVANAIAGEYFNSRLTSLVRDKLGLTYGLESSLSFAKDLGEFSVVSSAKNENIGFLLQKTLEVLEGMKKEPVTEEELQNAKNFVIGNFSVNHATHSAIAARWLVGHLLGMGSDYVSEYAKRIQAVTVSQVQTVVRDHFDLESRVVVFVGDPTAIEKTLTLLKKKKGANPIVPQIKQVLPQDLR